MRSFLLVALIILLTCGWAAAQAVAPATSQPTSVLVLPFTAPAADGYQWVGQSVQQVLAADLTHGTTLKVIAPSSATPAADADAALKSAADVGAGIVIFGQTQIIDKEIRLTGQVLEATTGQAITGLKATGPTDQLFHLEDAVASDALNSLPDRMRDDEWRQQTGYAAEPQASSSPAVGYDQGYPPSDDNNYYADSYPSYAYPGYSYPYSYPYAYYSPGFIVTSHFHDHDHDSDHFHDHGFHGNGFHDNGFHGNGFHGNGFHGNGFHSSGFMGHSSTFSHGSMFSPGFSGGGRSMMGAPRMGGGGFRGGGFGGGGFGGGGFGGGGFHGGMGMGGRR